VTARARVAAVVAIPAFAVALSLVLTGCGNLGAHPASGVDTSTGAVGTSTLAPTSSSAADDSTLDGISQDLDSAGAANSEAGSNAQAGDRAAASSDEP
jgi:hypothetical protein